MNCSALLAIFISPITVPAGKRGVVGWAIEGQFAEINAISAGGPDQVITIPFDDVLGDPIFVYVTTGDTTVEWTRVDIKEKFTATDTVFEVRHTDKTTQILFGDDIAGQSPLSGQEVLVRFRRGGGVRGRIRSLAIDESRQISTVLPEKSSAQVTFRNLEPSKGGLDKESLPAVARRAPREFATHDNITTSQDYATTVQTFNHPVYGSVFKATAVTRASLNANLVELYVLQNGPDNNPVAPSLGLKKGIETFVSEKNVLTDHVRVYDGAIKSVDLDIVVVISRSADASVTKKRLRRRLASSLILLISIWVRAST